MDNAFFCYAFDHLYALLPGTDGRNPLGSSSRAEAQERQERPKIVEKLAGNYILKGGSVGGNKMTADRIANVSVKITDQTITTYDGQREQRFGAAYRILNDKQPWQISLKSVKKVTTGDNKVKEKVEESEGIVEVSEDGKTLKLAYAVDGSERPKDFKGGKQQNVFELERLP